MNQLLRHWRYGVLFLLLWVVLTKGNLQQIWLGFVFAFLAVLASLKFADLSKSQDKIRIFALVRYLAYFLYHSLLGGIDVARRAFRFNRNVKPIYIEYPLRIPRAFEDARILFLISICMFPGSLTCDYQGDVLTIQVLDEDLLDIESLQELESLVGALYSVKL